MPPPASPVVDVFSDVVISIREPHVAVPISVARAPRALVHAPIRVRFGCFPGEVFAYLDLLGLLGLRLGLLLS